MIQPMRIRVCAAGVGLLLLGFPPSMTAQPSPPRTLYVSVMDPTGAPATDLTPADRLGHWQMRWGIGRIRYRIAPGLYALSARATDDLGGVGTSATATIEVMTGV